MELSELQAKINSTTGILIYFKQKNCGPCEAIRPKIRELVEGSFPRLELLFLDLEEDRNLAPAYEVYAAPTILVFFEGKEFLRKSKNLSIPGFQEEISRLYDMVFGEAM